MGGLEQRTGTNCREWPLAGEKRGKPHQEGAGTHIHPDAVFWGDFSCFSWGERDKKGRGPGEKEETRA